MALSRSLYELKRFYNSSHRDFEQAILIYVRNMPDVIRTNSNEIASWLDGCPDTFEGHFYVFGFYRNKKIIGYAEVSYFPIDRLFVCDYIVVDKPQRSSGAFSEFVDQLREHLEGLHPEYRYAVAEVGYGPGEHQPSQDSRLLERLLKGHGFQIVRASYFQPRLAVNDVESEIPADILIFSNSSANRIRSETYLSIVHTIYYKYYLPWYSTTPAVAKAYRKHLDRLYSRVQSSLGRKQYVHINGHQTVLQAAAPAKPPEASNRALLLFGAQSLALIVSVTAVLVVLRSAFHLTDYFVFAIYVLVLMSLLAIQSVVSKDARVAFAQSSSVVKSLFGRHTAGSKPSARETGLIEANDQDEL